MQESLFENDGNILPDHGEVYYYPSFFSNTESELYFQKLKDEVEWKQEPIKIFGKEIMQPRLTAWFGDKAYTYSGITMQPKKWSETLLAIKKKVEVISKTEFSSALLNLYRDGNDSMGWHRDNEKELGVNPVIGSVSFGASRMFQLRNYRDKKIIRSIELRNGSFLLMRGETQHYWEHRVPKQTKEQGQRINITFRVIA